VRTANKYFKDHYFVEQITFKPNDLAAFTLRLGMRRHFLRTWRQKINCLFFG
jgi:hypothetical protein